MKGKHRAPRSRQRDTSRVSLGIVLGLVFAMAVPAGATDYTDNVIKDSHKVAVKHDHSGTYTTLTPYNWGGLAPGGTEWSYKVHVKEAVSQWASRGTVHLTSATGVDVVCKVEYARSGYQYWDNLGRTDVLFAAGTANYNGTTYYCMFLEAEEAMWMVLSTEPWTDLVDAGVVYGGLDRAYQTHSLTGSGLVLPEKPIHTS